MGLKDKRWKDLAYMVSRATDPEVEEFEKIEEQVEKACLTDLRFDELESETLRERIKTAAEVARNGRPADVLRYARLREDYAHLLMEQGEVAAAAQCLHKLAETYRGLGYPDKEIQRLVLTAQFLPYVESSERASLAFGCKGWKKLANFSELGTKRPRARKGISVELLLEKEDDSVYVDLPKKGREYDRGADIMLPWKLRDNLELTGVPVDIRTTEYDFRELPSSTALQWRAFEEHIVQTSYNILKTLAGVSNPEPNTALALCGVMSQSFRHAAEIYDTYYSNASKMSTEELAEVNKVYADTWDVMKENVGKDFREFLKGKL